MSHFTINLSNFDLLVCSVLTKKRVIASNLVGETCGLPRANARLATKFALQT